MCVDSPSMEECLPQEMLEAVLGKLDGETLRTARLVSRTFCAAASANISSITFRCPTQAVSLERFPGLGHVIVHHCEDSLEEIDPRLRAVITHLIVSPDYEQCDSMELPEMPGMPKLRELNVGNVDAEVDFEVKVDGAEVLHSLTNLEVLKLRGCTPTVAKTIAITTSLTSLVIGRVLRPGEWLWASAEVSWLQYATSLTKLQALQITVPHEGLPLIGNLTTLTGLTLCESHGGPWGTEETGSIAPLSRLKMLSSLEIYHDISESDLAVACSLGSGSLANLRLWVSKDAPSDCGRLLARQTPLKALIVGGPQLCNLRHMGALRMESLQSLELQWLETAHAEGLAVLQKATSLTELQIDADIKQPDTFPSQTLGRLTQLRSLQLRFHAPGVHAANLNLHLALGRLTALTELRISMACLYDADLRALQGLAGLQVLKLVHCRPTFDVVRELAALTNLRLRCDYCQSRGQRPETRH